MIKTLTYVSKKMCCISTYVCRPVAQVFMTALFCTFCVWRGSSQESIEDVEVSFHGVLAHDSILLKKVFCFFCFFLFFLKVKEEVEKKVRV